MRLTTMTASTTTTTTNIPDDVIFKIYQYVPLTIPVCRTIRNYTRERLNTFAKVIQKWYTKYKLPKTNEIILSDWYSNKYPQWFMIRHFMKFYPKDELITVAHYMIKYMIPDRRKKFLKDYENIKNNYDVFKLLQNANKREIIASGW